jgi:hypothetical protein
MIWRYCATNIPKCKLPNVDLSTSLQGSVEDEIDHSMLKMTRVKKSHQAKSRRRSILSRDAGQSVGKSRKGLFGVPDAQINDEGEDTTTAPLLLAMQCPK